MILRTEEPGISHFTCEGGGFSLGDEEEEDHEEDHGPQAGPQDREEDLEEEDLAALSKPFQAWSPAGIDNNLDVGL